MADDGAPSPAAQPKELAPAEQEGFCAFYRKLPPAPGVLRIFDRRARSSRNN